MIKCGSYRISRISVLLLVAIVAVAMFALPGCKKVKEKAAGAAETALGLVEKGAEIAGEATANWLGTTAGNVGKNFNKTIVERLAYLEITVDNVDKSVAEAGEGDAEDEDAEGVEGEDAETEISPGIVSYAFDLTINNTAPNTEKIYINVLLDDYYLVACDQDDYTYSLYDRSYENNIMPGKSKLTVYTELAEPDEISYLLFIGDKISLP